MWPENLVRPAYLKPWLWKKSLWSITFPAGWVSWVTQAQSPQSAASHKGRGEGTQGWIGMTLKTPRSSRSSCAAEQGFSDLLSRQGRTVMWPLSSLECHQYVCYNYYIRLPTELLSMIINIRRLLIWICDSYININEYKYIDIIQCVVHI